MYPQANEQPLKDVLREMVATYRMKAKLHESRLRQAWQSTMPLPIRQATTAIQLRKRKLIITVNSSTLRHDLSMGREKLRKQLNKHLQEDYLEEVIIR